MVSPSQSVEQLIIAARQRNPADRAAFLDTTCRHAPELRRAVEDRLRDGDRGNDSTMDASVPGLNGRQNSAPMAPRGPGFVPGQLIAGRFIVVRYIDRGGMGEVYEVQDRLLQGVRVALKVILPEIACDAGSSHRFEQEVLLARKVTHPNLCPIYDIARSSDPPPPFLFLTMKLLEGETLSARLLRPEPIPRDEKISIFCQIMAGVSALHAAGIIHRDIKPNNVMLDHSGPTLCLSLMDFGLARLHEPETTSPTRSLIAGTPGYMAPEIFCGQGPSQATDLFAVGVLLHQVATGEHPHFGPLSHSVAPSPALAHADLPCAFLQATKDFLSSDPARRCETARTIHADFDGRISSQQPRTKNSVKALVGTVCLLILLVSVLLVPAVGERVRGILFASAEKHIVVLPFGLTGNDPETQALGDGLMDSLAGRLSNLDTTNKSLWVVPAQEVRSRKVSDAGSALHEFGATLVVEGKFERDNETTRLKLTLIDPKKIREIGFVDVDDKAGDMGALQDQAIIRLGRLMNIKGSGEIASRTEKPVPRAAYEDYLLALGYAQRFDRPGNLDRAIDSLQNALKTDPHFTVGLARLAQVYVLKYRMDRVPAWLDLAKQYAEQALRLDPRVPLAHVALGQVEQLTGHHDLAAQEFQHAIDLDSRDPEALTGLAVSDRDLGRNSEAEAIYIRAANLRPDDWNGYNNLAQFYQRIGRPNDAIRELRRALELSPDNSALYANLGGAYLDTGDPKMIVESERALNKSIAINPNFAAYANLGIIYGAQGRYPDSVAAIEKALKLHDQDYTVWTNLAEGYEWLGDGKNSAYAGKRAKEILLQRIKLDPQNADAQATLALLLAKEHLEAEAINKIQIALALQPDDQSVLSAVADAYELLGNRPLAIRYLQKAVVSGMPATALRTDPYIRKLIIDPHFHSMKSQVGG